MLTYTRQLGTVGELKAMTEFTRHGFTIYAPVSDGNDPFDFIACRDSKLIKVEVKSSAARNHDAYVVTIAATRINKTRNAVRYFNTSQCDILAAYIQPIDTVCFIESSKLDHNKTAIAFRETPTKHANGRKQWIISEYTDIEKALIDLCNNTD